MPNQTAAFLGPFDTIQRRAANPSLVAGAAPGALDFTIQVQQQSNWCWAAVAASVLDYCAVEDGTPAMTQTAIAGQFLNAPTDNTPYPLSTALQFLHHQQGIVGTQMAFVDIVTEIGTRKRPVCCKIDWYDGSDGHYVVIMGCHNDSEQDVIILDPADAKFIPLHGAYTYKEFQQAYGSGHWGDTYQTK